jgi:hypothetical protein
MTVILYGILLAHFNTYRNQYANIGITFAVSFLMKRLLKSAGQKEHGEIVGLGGYTLTIGEFVKLLGQMKKNGIGVQSEEANQIMGGLLGKGLDSLVEMFKK